MRTTVAPSVSSISDSEESGPLALDPPKTPAWWMSGLTPKRHTSPLNVLLTATGVGPAVRLVDLSDGEGLIPLRRTSVMSAELTGWSKAETGQRCPSPVRTNILLID